VRELVNRAVTIQQIGILCIECKMFTTYLIVEWTGIYKKYAEHRCIKDWVHLF